MTVDEINEKKVQLGHTKVLVDNIGPGGLLFTSNIKLPEKAKFTLKFKVNILDEELIYMEVFHILQNMITFIGMV